MDIKIHRSKKKAFKPLQEFLSDWSNDKEDIDQTLSQYMYMCHDEEKTYYKHFGNRKYFNICYDGTTEGEIEDWRNW
ncbi:hypothetical protein AS888_20800 [Peribacillus simplex]|uniref:Uncharacterized protein n=1 Tax=Peribacillus simplex TaxID=1478 RepID=A0A109MXA3_9BACI|nr:hypothetical protein [Peribacillus simplex]KWW17953.1 hypothetical protein AS888_20800 [Peribacillus simplex]